MKRKKTILIADDDMFVREIIGEILTEAGYDVKFADDGKEAVYTYQQENAIDLIITDMNMPRMNGMELVETIRMVDQEVPIIVLTVNTELGTAVEAIRKGADDYILKGDTISEALPISVAKVLEIYELKTQNRDLIIDLSRKNSELERLAFLDALTGVSNRGHFDATLTTEWDYAMRKRQPISVIMTDIDNFKTLNDTLGHEFGDLCLQQAARALNKTLKRSTDFLARYGGDEFVSVLPGTAMEDAEEIAEEMRKHVNSLLIEEEKTQSVKSFSMSFGVYGLIPQPGSEPRIIMDGADRALYQAKHLGRNRVFAGEVPNDQPL